MARTQGTGGGGRRPVTGRALGGQVAGRSFKAVGPAGRRPLGIQRVERVSRSVAPKRPVARSAAAYIASRAKGKPTRPVVGGSVPKLNIRIPKIDFNPGRAIRDAFGNAAPQDTLFREIGNRLKNPR